MSHLGEGVDIRLHIVSIVNKLGFAILGGGDHPSLLFGRSYQVVIMVMGEIVPFRVLADHRDKIRVEDACGVVCLHLPQQFSRLFIHIKE